jgi:hypothetical protein
MHIAHRIRVIEIKFSSYMRIGVIEDSQGYYIHEEDFIGLHVNMGMLRQIQLEEEIGNILLL